MVSWKSYGSKKCHKILTFFYIVKNNNEKIKLKVNGSKQIKAYERFQISFKIY